MRSAIHSKHRINTALSSIADVNVKATVSISLHAHLIYKVIERARRQSMVTFPTVGHWPVPAYTAW